jgi:ribosome-associated protein
MSGAGERGGRRSDLVVRRGVVIPASELVETASRAGGPGGQHVNKASTRVTLRWNAVRSAALGPIQRARLRARLARRLTASGELIVHASRRRSRARNREDARARLAELVREGLRVEAPRRPTRPRPGARERTLAEKRQRGTLKRARGRVRGEE